MSGYTIGEMARATGVHVETIRYYHRVGLLPVPPRNDRGPRRYGPDAVERLLLIRRARRLTFSLAQIARLVAVMDGRNDCADARTVAAARLAEVERDLATLQMIGRELAELVRRCDAAGSGDCPIVRELSRTDGAIS